MRGLYPQRAIEASIAPHLHLHCDPARVAQLLSTLLTNALVHGSGHTPVRVAASLAGGEFVLSVMNEGGELPQSVIDGLFKPYWRAASRSGSEGLGLGLYIVDQIARAWRHDRGEFAGRHDGVRVQAGRRHPHLRRHGGISISLTQLPL